MPSIVVLPDNAYSLTYIRNVGTGLVDPRPKGNSPATQV